MIRNGVRGRKQLYRCKACKKQFFGDRRHDKSQVITDYVEGKQTLGQLALKYGVNERTIRRDLLGMRDVQRISRYKQVIVQMDTTYRGRRFGLMVIRDALHRQILWRKYVTHETIADYMEGIEWLKSNGLKIYGAVIDGMKGLARTLFPIPVQLCQFHQMLTLRHYLTKEPELEVSRELLGLANSMIKMDKDSFIKALNRWYGKYQDVLNERVQDKRIKRKTPPYMRPRLRCAFFSIKRNMPLL